MTLVSSADKEHPYKALFVKDQTIMSKRSRQAITNLPLKLPMICPPKPYSKNILGGYLLNDDKFSEQLLVEKKAYSMTS